MPFIARLNKKFYIFAFILLCFVLLGWYGIYFLNTNEVLLHDNLPMDVQTKTIATVLLSIVLFTWTVSLFTMIKQIISSKAFYIDEGGIHCTATGIIIFAFIIIVPVRNIPFDATKSIFVESDVLTVKVDKSKIDINPLFRLFVRGEYRFFNGFILEEQDDIKLELEKYIKA